MERTHPSPPDFSKSKLTASERLACELAMERVERDPEYARELLYALLFVLDPKERTDEAS